jgi:hypothetical protein
MAYIQQNTSQKKQHDFYWILEKGRKRVLHYGYSYIALKSTIKRFLWNHIQKRLRSQKTD